MGRLIQYALLSSLAVGAIPAQAQQVIQARGADQRVQYSELARIGPWDDRNYHLTVADLELLAVNEAELRMALPVFYRVLLRQNHPNLPRDGPAQYPRSALQIYLQEYGGYQVDDRLELRLDLHEGRYRVIQPVPPQAREPDPHRFLAGEVRVTFPTGASESAIKFHPEDPNIVIAGSNGPGFGQKMHFSTDGGYSWASSELPLGGTCCDPTVDWSSDGSYAYTATLGNCTTVSFCSVWFYRSSDNGQTWNDLSSITPGDPRRELTTGQSDKEFLHVDKHPGSPCQDDVYLTWHENFVMQFARSTDSGNTWATASFTSDPMGIGSDITSDANGDIYFFWPGFNDKKILLKKSTDCGVSFGQGTTTVANTNGAYDFPIPAMESRRAWIYVSADADLSDGPFSGSLYAAWTDTDGPESPDPEGNHTRIQVGFSRDGGSTWTVVTPHETSDVNTVDRWNQWLAVGPDGTVHLIYYDSQHSTARSGADVYYTFSNDGGQTYSEPARLTAVTSPNLHDPNEFGDYNGVDFLERVLAVYTDNRPEAGGAGDSRDVYAASRSPSRLLAAEGKVTLLRVHDVGTGYGPPNDFLDVEVVIRLDSNPEKAYGFQLRPGPNLDTHRHMLDVLRTAFRNDQRVHVDYESVGLRNGLIRRVWTIR